MLCAIALLALPSVPLTLLNDRFLPHDVWCFWLGATLTAAGLLFSIWARHHLGKFWSARVALKQDHELIRSGPYAYVRHPIYSGLFIALIGTALVIGEWRALLAVLLVFLAHMDKARREEKLLAEQFGEAFATYRAETGWLFPGL